MPEPAHRLGLLKGKEVFRHRAGTEKCRLMGTAQAASLKRTACAYSRSTPRKELTLLRGGFALLIRLSLLLGELVQLGEFVFLAEFGKLRRAAAAAEVSAILVGNKHAL